LLAARGAIAPRALEQLALLALLTEDADPEVRRTAAETLDRIPTEAISTFIARSEVPAELRAFFVARGVPVASAPAAEAPEAFVDEDTVDYGPEPVTEEEKQSIVQRLATMSVPERVKAAMKGGREMRAILIRDPNKLVALAVLSSPKMSETEVESIARMGSVSEDVLRAIAQNRAWTKNYGIILALVRNPKTPLTFSMNFLSRLVDKDLKQLSTNRNVPETLRIAARKKVVLSG
ncbi:MAG TPA: hypothetical protein VFY80_01115, partial [Burkholderiales bacterium]|nr:hypothetical protein [Burkholderiales bacterium]